MCSKMKIAGMTIDEYAQLTSEIKPLEDEIHDSFIKASKYSDSIDEKICLLKRGIASYSLLKDILIAKGKYVYLAKFWEFEYKGSSLQYVDYFRKMLQEIEDNYEEEKRKEIRKKETDERKRHILQSIDLDWEIIDLVSKNPGILQVNLYNSFDADIKNEVMFALYEIEKRGVINRVKNGRSYALYVN